MQKVLISSMFFAHFLNKKINAECVALMKYLRCFLSGGGTFS